MGTRSTVRFVSDSKTILTLYCQYDGYLSGVGKQIHDFVSSGEMVNGIPLGATTKLFNGMGDLAAQFLAAVKESAGGWYCVAPDHGDEEFNYIVQGARNGDMNPKPPRISVRYGDESFTGTIAQFGKFIQKERV